MQIFAYAKGLAAEYAVDQQRGGQQHVADYYGLPQLAVKLGSSEAQIAELELNGLLLPKLRAGRRFDLLVAQRIGREQKVSLERALACVEEMRLCQASEIGS